MLASAKRVAKIKYSFLSLLRIKRIACTPERWEKHRERVNDQKKYLARQ